MARPEACLLTAATDDFVPGTFVMVCSFLKHHPRFDGDVVVVHDGLSDASREVLAASFPRLRFEPVSLNLRDRVARLCAVRPEIGVRRASFWFLDAFRPRGYRKVLCCDGDLLFRGSIKALFDAPGALLCGRDQFSLRGRPRDAVTYLPVDETAVPAAAPARPTLAETFNCGFLLIDGRLIEEARPRGPAGAAGRGAPHPRSGPHRPRPRAQRRYRFATAPWDRGWPRRISPRTRTRNGPRLSPRCRAGRRPWRRRMASAWLASPCAPDGHRYGSEFRRPSER